MDRCDVHSDHSAATNKKRRSNALGESENTEHKKICGKEKTKKGECANNKANAHHSSEPKKFAHSSADSPKKSL